MMKYQWMLLTAAACSLAIACSETTGPDDEFEIDPRLAEEVPIGETNEPGELKEDGFSHNGEEDFSEECKPIPDVEPLEDPEIVVSVDGRSIRLFDNAGDYERVFPVGLGKVRADGTSRTPLSEDEQSGVFYARADAEPVVDGSTSSRRRWAWNYSCRIWSGSKYNNPLSGEEEYRSYFAGLPFIRLEGTDRAVYGFHGPINNYWRENGGELYRGYVSGGCLRMDPDDLVELYGRILGHKTPVRIQQAIDVDEETGLSVDANRFANAGCIQDSDCDFEGAKCVEHPDGSGRFCTRPCEQQSDCPIQENDIVGSIGVWSFCIDDEHDLVETPGYCVIEGNGKTNNNCKSYPANFEKRQLPTLDEGSDTYSVCAVP
jgi:lipoprotein-anchoring transpeptidase ErfK/SrfK